MDFHSGCGSPIVKNVSAFAEMQVHSGETQPTRCDISILSGVDGKLKDKLLPVPCRWITEGAYFEMAVISVFSNNFFLIRLANVLKNSLSYDFTD